jgi:acetyl-CoA acetyltransferase
MTNRYAAIIGIGTTAYTRGSGRSEWEMAIEAIGKAIDEAEIEASDVDGLVRCSYDNVDEAMIVRSFPMQLSSYAEVGYGGLGAPAVIAHAADAVISGRARYVVCYRSLNGYSRTRYGRAERSLSTGDDVIARGDRAPSGAFAGPYGLLAPGQIMALWLRRYMALYQVDESKMRDALGVVAVTQRAYAQRNPAALMAGKPLTLDEYHNARPIYSPLRLFDFALETDGAVAFVVASSETARHYGSRAAWIRASEQGLFRYAESVSIYGPLRNTGEYLASARRLYRRAGLQPEDISVSLLYDATTVTVLLALEAYGFAPEGAGWRYLLDHGIGPTSPMPVNTNGGHLSEAYVHYFNSIAEAVRQCRGESHNQVNDLRHVLCASGPTSLILSREEP